MLAQDGEWMMTPDDENPYLENIAGSYFSLDEDKPDDWHRAEQIQTPKNMACLDELEVNISWKGNADALCSIVLIREGDKGVGQIQQQAIIYPFGTPKHKSQVHKATCKIHVMYSNLGFMGHYRPGDCIGV